MKRNGTKHRLIALTALLGGSALAAAAVWALSGDLNAHDPAIVKEGNTWWTFRTWGAGIGVTWSGDGRTWNTGTPIFQNGLAWWKQYNGNTNWTWAPSVANHGGKALCFYAVSTFGSQKSAIGLATANSIGQGNWTDQGAILTSQPGNSWNAIDPAFVADTSNQPWLTFGSWNSGIFITRLNSSYRPTGAWSNIAYHRDGIENSQVVRNGSYYYLFASIGTCCSGAQSTYRIVYGRSSSITGPYYDKNGVDMRNSGGTLLDGGSARFIAPGGNSTFNDNGQWVMARHELDASNNYATVYFINDLYWSNGWPTY